MPPPNTYYVYVAKLFDTLSGVARHFGVTEQQILAANPQWKNRVVIILKAGEEVVMPDSVENSPLFSIVKGELIVRQRKTTEQKPATYPANWFPPKPSFVSPSVNLSAFLTKLGNPKYKIGTNPGGELRHRPIIFTDGWVGKNVSYVEIPQLKDKPIPVKGGFVKCSGKIQFYTKAHKAVQELFKAWEDDGLIPKILTFGGSFVPRTIGSGTNPSNHSFGTAFDINAKWNDQGDPPAGIGKDGCLLELVPRANELGFFWGGFYSGGAVDGMHFEYAKL